MSVRRDVEGRPTSWGEAYKELRSYAADHESIQVTPRSLSVPRDERPEFYRRVEDVQDRLGRQVLGGRVDQVELIARRCTAIRDGLVASTNLTAFGLAPTLESFLANPVRTVAKPAFSLVLDGLQNDLLPDVIEAQATRAIVPFCDALCRNAYEAWAYYGVVAALRPREFYAVVSPNAIDVHAVRATEVSVGYQATSPQRRVPEAVFTTEDGRVFAMKSEAARELDFYTAKIVRRRDSSAGGNTQGAITHRVLMLWQLGAVDEVGVVADRDKPLLVPTDLMCEVLTPQELADPLFGELFASRVNAVRSRRPVQAIVMEGGEAGAGGGAAASAGTCTADAQVAEQVDEGFLERLSGCALPGVSAQIRRPGLDDALLEEMARALS